MRHRQKESILALLKSDEVNKNYENKYCFSYEDFLDPTDSFTMFSCENLDKICLTQMKLQKFMQKSMDLKKMIMAIWLRLAIFLKTIILFIIVGGINSVQGE